MNFIQEHEARLEKARRQMSEDLKSASARAMPEQVKTPGVDAVAAGSPAVSSAEILDVARQLEKRAAQCAAESGQPAWQHPGETRESLKHDEAVLKHCAQLLRQVVAATVRQPQENT